MNKRQKKKRLKKILKSRIVIFGESEPPNPICFTKFNDQVEWSIPKGYKADCFSVPTIRVINLTAK